MPSAENTRSLPDGDFRMARAYLADEVFFQVPGGNVPPDDQLPQEEWDYMMDLATDVVLRTTDYLGSMVGDMLTQEGAWIEAMPDDPAKNSFMFDAALDAHSEFQAAPFIAAHGYYRQATASLRNALELMATAARYAVRQDHAGYQRWRAATDEPKFGNAVDILGMDTSLAAIDGRLGAPGLFGNKPSGVLRSLYTRLCSYAHSRPDYSNPDLWASNGPVFISRVFTQFWKDYCDTLAACYVLFKIGYASLDLPDSDRSTRWPAPHGTGLRQRSRRNSSHSSFTGMGSDGEDSNSFRRLSRQAFRLRSDYENLWVPRNASRR